MDGHQLLEAAVTVHTCTLVQKQRSAHVQRSAQVQRSVHQRGAQVQRTDTAQHTIPLYVRVNSNESCFRVGLPFSLVFAMGCEAIRCAVQFREHVRQ